MAYQPHIVAAPNEFKLPWQPHVGISDVKFGPEGARHLVAVTGWDGSVYVYDVQSSTDPKQKMFYFHGRPALNCAFAGSSKLVSAGVDRTVKVADIATSKTENLGTHDLGVRCVRYSDKLGLIASGGWDNQIKVWDPRSPGAGAAQQGSCSDRVYAMDIRGDQIIVGTRDRKIYLFDMRNMQEPVQTRDSPLKFQTRTVAFFPSDDAFVVSSIEGRVAVEYINQSADEQARKYAFKCHRQKDANGIELIYPVNAVAFHPTYSSFATGGSDAQVNIWDPYNRKRLVQFHTQPTSIVGLDFNVDGSQIAIASSYAYEQETDPNPIPPSSITIRALTDGDCRIKSV
ncbi:unnamed protein product, partial [Mesorhabditis belari]|uniref:Mitotic checkpoint protein BUB3 n=1 Tax=Mesorhabditis belari TaxID=2138241 RepID=A0AAF3FKY3_9BILA